MKKSVMIFLLVVIMMTGLQYSQEADLPGSAAGEIIVKYKEEVIGNGNEVFVKENNELLVYDFVERPISSKKVVEGFEIYNLKFDESENIEELIEDYEKIEEVDYVEPNYFFETFRVVNDSSYSSQHGLRNINAEQAWNLTVGSREVIISIIDTGVDWDHPDLSDNIWNNSDEGCDENFDLDNNSYNGDCRGYDFVDVSNCTDNDCSDEDNDPMDYNGHGTHVAGIASGVRNGIEIVGVCWNCSIMPVRAGYDSSGSGILSVSDAIEALYYSADNDADIISMSFGGTSSIFLEEAIKYASNKSILVSSAGNAGTNDTRYPCFYDEVICVASIGEDNESSGFSNYGEWVDVAAPGSGIYSTFFNDTYKTLHGTSMSTPFVSGSIGIIKSLFDKNRTQIRDVLRRGDFVDFNGINISRLDVYSSILHFDDIKPNVSLTSPLNNKIDFNVSQRFSCNASDWQLKNMTWTIWNSSGLVYEDRKNVTGIFDESEFNVSLDYGDYSWNCLYYDEKDNFGISENFSISINNIINTTVSQVYPLNDSYINGNVSFNCSAQTRKELMNITFNLWNGSGLVHSFTDNVSGIFDSREFTYNFSEEGDYSWNCNVYDNESILEMTENFSLVYDVTSPFVELVSPENETSFIAESETEEVEFSFNFSEDYIESCSLVIDNEVNVTNDSVSSDFVNSFNVSFGLGNYEWKVSCQDRAGNSGNSVSRNFVVNANEEGGTDEGSGGGSGGGGGGSGGGGGGSSSSNSGTSSITGSAIASAKRTYFISREQGLDGYEKELAEKDEIRFTLSDGDEFDSSLVVGDIEGERVEIEIRNFSVNLALQVGESRKLNLTNEEYYDFYVSLESINESKAEMVIQFINEEIVRESLGPGITGFAVDETGFDLGSLEEYKNKSNLLVLFILIVVMFILFKEKVYLKEAVKKNKVNKSVNPDKKKKR